MKRSSVAIALLLALVSPGGATAQTGDLSMIQEIVGGSSVSEFAFTQTAHGLTLGQWVMFDDSTGNWVLLDTDTIDFDVYAVAFVSSVTDVNTIRIVVQGKVTSVGHGFTVGPLWAASTAGIVTTTTPVLGTKEWVVGVALDANTIVVQQKEWSQL